MDRTDFPKRLAAEIERQLGPGATDKHSPEQLVKLFDLGISRETLRRILRKGYSPKSAIQESLLEKVRHRVTTAEKYLTTSKTRDEVFELMRTQAGVEIPRGPGDLLPCDLLMEPLGLGLSPVFLRCLDDAGDIRLVHSSYFEPVIGQMKQAMDALGIREAVLITHRYPNADAVSLGAAYNVKLLEYSMFIAQRLRLPQIAAFFSEKRRERGIIEGVFESLPAVQVTDSESVAVNSLEALREFLFRPAGSAVAVILGSFGTGKTSVLLVLAHEIAKRFENASTDWIIPLWLNASAINLPDVDKALVGGLNALTAGPSLPIETIKRLIRSGRIWLFVDGVDESPQLRGSDAVAHLMKALSDLCGAGGRLIVSGRQEMFDSFEQEQQLFDKAPEEIGIQRRLILRMDKMSPETAGKVLRLRLGPQGLALVDQIQANTALADLATRPIFMHIIAETADQLGIARDKIEVTKLFDIYVRKWVAEENKKTNLLPIREEERLRTCEALALIHTQYGSSLRGFSLSDLERFARSEASPTLSIRDLPAFLNEARVAMFLERRESDRFDFAHHSLREFFIARRLSREIKEGFLLSLGAVSLGRSDRLARFFVCEFLESSALDPVIPLDRAIKTVLSWNGEENVDGLKEESKPGPLFGVGPYCHLLPNLVSLRLEASASAPVDLRGAHLPMVNLDNIIGDHVGTDRILILDDANLEGASAGTRQLKTLRSRGAIGPADFASRDTVHRYCHQHSLYEPTRFSRRGEEEFVLIPGGIYQIKSQDSGKESKAVEVKVPAFLIQRYPVTNEEFGGFISRFPYWNPEKVRARSNNDYYLSYWHKFESDYDEWARRPVVQVNWYAARAYAAASGLRLPTEVEWEIASRVAQGEALWERPWGNDLEWNGKPCVELSNFEGEDPPMFSEKSVLDVPEGFGDWESSLGFGVPRHLLGLIREWVLDHWAPDYPSSTTRLFSVNLGYEKDDDGRWGPTREMLEDRVIRGGGFISPLPHVSCSYRAPHRPNNVNPDVGFRCVRPIRALRVD